MQEADIHMLVQKDMLAHIQTHAQTRVYGIKRASGDLTLPLVTIPLSQRWLYFHEHAVRFCTHNSSEIALIQLSPQPDRMNASICRKSKGGLSKPWDFCGDGLLFAGRDITDLTSNLILTRMR